MITELNELDTIYKLAIGSSPVVVPFLNKVLGPTGDEIGKYVLSRLKQLPIIKQISLYSKADEMLKHAGIEARKVEPKVLIPLVEAASLEEDQALFDKWASLLANAAAYEQGAIQLAFIEVLKQLTPRQAQMLDTLFQLAPGDLPPSQPALFGAFRPRTYGFEGYLQAVKAYGDVDGELNQDVFNATHFNLDNLIRLRLIIGPEDMAGTKSMFELNTVSIGEHHRIRTPIKTLSISHFGHSFVVACQPPIKQDASYVQRINS